MFCGKLGKLPMACGRRLIAALALVAAAAMLVLPPAPAGAQDTAPPIPAASGAPAPDAPPEDLQDLLDLLRDDAERAAFVARLEALLATTEEVEEVRPRGIAQRLTLALSRTIDQVSRRTIGGVDALLDVPRLFNQLAMLVANPVVRTRWLEIAAKLVVVLGLAALAFAGARRMVANARRRLAERQPQSIGSRLSALVLRIGVDLWPIFAFAIVAYIVLPLTEPRPFTRIVAISAINVTIAIQLVLMASRAVLTPHSPHLRVVQMANETAAYLYVWVRRLSYLGGYVLVVAGALELLGFSEVGTVVSRLGGLIVALMLIVVILQNRAGVRRRLRGRSEHPRSRHFALRRQLAEVWHVLAVLYVVAVFFVWALRVPGGFEFVFRGTVVTFIVAIAARVLIGLVTAAVERGFSVGARLHEQYPTLQARANRYLPVLRTGTVTVILIIGALAILQAWRVPVSTWLLSDVGRGATSAVATIVLVVVVAAALWELVSTTIERYLDMTTDDGEIVERTARERTLLPLLRNAILVILIVVVGLIVLAEIGLNIAPLLAAAGVVGIAIGFGSQKLVQDVINGLFILFEDTISVGDIVDVAGHRGLVESLSVRNLTLRDLEGHVHTVPFSEVATIRNMSKEFSFALMDVGIAYRENVAEVIEVLKQLGAELEVDPAIGPLILEPIEILGLDEFADSAIVVKARMKTIPTKQWTVRRAFNLRMKERFDDLGIEIPFPHMTLYFGEDKAGQAPPLRVANRPPAPNTTTSEPTQATEARDAPASSDG